MIGFSTFSNAFRGWNKRYQRDQAKRGFYIFFFNVNISKRAFDFRLFEYSSFEGVYLCIKYYYRIDFRLLVIYTYNIRVKFNLNILHISYSTFMLYGMKSKITPTYIYINVCNYERYIVMRIIKRNILLSRIIEVKYYFREERKRVWERAFGINRKVNEKRFVFLACSGFQPRVVTDWTNEKSFCILNKKNLSFEIPHTLRSFVFSKKFCLATSNICESAFFFCIKRNKYIGIEYGCVSSKIPARANKLRISNHAVREFCIKYFRFHYVSYIYPVCLSFFLSFISYDDDV